MSGRLVPHQTQLTPAEQHRSLARRLHRPEAGGICFYRKRAGPVRGPAGGQSQRVRFRCSSASPARRRGSIRSYRLGHRWFVTVHPLRRRQLPDLPRHHRNVSGPCRGHPSTLLRNAAWGRSTIHGLGYPDSGMADSLPHSESMGH